MSARAHGGVLTASKDGSKRVFLPPGAWVVISAEDDAVARHRS
jgi:hypothetical protein